MKLNKLLVVTLISLAIFGVSCSSLAQPTSIPFPTAMISTSIPPMSTLPTQPQVTLTPPPQPLPIGRWQIIRWSFAAISAMDKSQADTWLNKIADIGATSITFDGKTCQVTSTGRSTSTASDYFLVGFKTNPTNIGVTQDKLDVITTNCTGTAFEQFGQLDPTTLVIAWNGVFFFMAPAGQAAATVPLPPTTTPKRISFAPGATSATVQGNLAANSVDVYVLRVSGGQTIAVATNSSTTMWLLVNGADGQVLKPMGAGTANWSGVAPTTQDYYLTLGSQNGTPATYSLQVNIPPLATPVPEPPTPTRIAFPPGGTSATLQGTLPAFGLNPYVLRVFAGQTMTVNLTTNPAGKGFLVIYGADGNVLISDHAGAQTWSGTLPTTQDYNIHVRTGPDAASYTLQVIIPPSSGIDPRSTPKRIAFAAGATTATLQGNIAATVPDVYVLRASAGQVMAVRVTASQGQAALMIAGADGTVLVPDRVKSTNSSGNLPVTQDYYIQVNPLVSPVTYSLQVTIPSLNLVPSRIVFQPGTTSSIVQGVVAPNATDRYALRALAGQTMTIQLLSPNSQAVVMVWGSDGQVLIPDQSDATNWMSRLPASQDYLIDVWSIANADVGYSLRIDVPPLK